MTTFRKSLLMPFTLALWSLAGPASSQGVPDYRSVIQPTLDRYCVACHACYDAPCQLDLTRSSGIRRGASKQPVYDGTRLKEAAPSRLDIDAQHTSDWRDRGFFSVLGQENQASLLRMMLDLKDANPMAANEPLPEGLKIGIRRKNQCPTVEEMPAYARKHPHAGMPFAFPAVPANEAKQLRAWLDAGAPMQAPVLNQTPDEARQVRQWEDWLNGTRPEQQLVSRWLYEHLAFARLHFSSVFDGNDYRLVRSSMPSGQPVREIATRYPNSATDRPFYYRLQAELGTRVYKTLIRFTLNDTVLARVKKLFFSQPWQAGKLPGHSAEERANPFTTFRAIPAQARYQFMLDHAHYFTRTFIRGPVCRGQIATDVIRDHFWVLYQDPQQDLYVQDAGYRSQVDRLLALPGVDYDLLDGASAWLDASKDRNRYKELRKEAYRTQVPGGATLRDIWAGDGHNPNAMLTVFRHHNSATVVLGWQGQQPLTVWWMDYPLFERTYYNLVANFDVFGSLAHQAQTRLYFDLIRNGAEQNFLRLMPPEARQAMLKDWYRGSGKLKLWLAYEDMDATSPAGTRLLTASPYTELLDRLLRDFSHLNRTPDPINRPTTGNTDDEIALLTRLSHTPAKSMPAIRHLPDASLLRVTRAGKTHRVYSLIRNRMHTNVAFMLGESLRYEPERDELTVTPGISTGYPNFVFEVPLEELPAFVSQFQDPGNGKEAAFVRNIVDAWGLRRSDPRVWPASHAIHDFMKKTDPLEAGILDLNRYADYPGG